MLAKLPPNPIVSYMGFFDDLRAENEAKRRLYENYDQTVAAFNGAHLDVLTSRADTGRLEAWGFKAPFVGQVAVQDEISTVFYWRSDWSNRNHEAPLIVASAVPIDEQTANRPHSLRHARWSVDAVNHSRYSREETRDIVMEVATGRPIVPLSDVLVELERLIKPDYQRLERQLAQQRAEAS